MIEVQLFIPLADNAGRTFDQSHDETFVAYLTSEFGGCSQLPGNVQGAWQDAGVIYHDQNRIFMVVVEGMLAQSAKLNNAVTYAKAHYQQLAVYVRYLGMSEIL
jgi:hypothetical protein